ncbi:hypothetical protein [Chryseobacterium sp. W4I1]|uniref:hypothetical protein n=1 Tax=Chryseobacterium sp. W4I1 TaxID=3042293 RepID=UPI0027D7AE40|nr:hypothetical protein [Chryseobacterium sp. W4I1]
MQTSEWVEPSCGAFDHISGVKLENLGIDFIEIANETGQTTRQEYLLIYKGLPVAKGNKYIRKYVNLINKVKQASYNEEKLIDVLEEAFDDTWMFFDKEPASGVKYSTTSLENMYTVGSKKDFEKGVKYLTEKERTSYEVFVQYDKIVDSEGNLIDTYVSISTLEDGTSVKTEYAIFVMSEEGKIYLSKNRQVGEFHHSSFLEGKPISAGGEILIKQGRIKEINNGSGHYRPTLDLVEKNTIKELQNRGYFNIENPKENIQFKSEF